MKKVTLLLLIIFCTGCSHKTKMMFANFAAGAAQGAIDQLSNDLFDKSQKEFARLERRLK